MKTFPPFEQLKDQAARYVVQKAQSDLIATLREAAKIERFDDEPSPTRRRRPGRRRCRRACRARGRRQAQGAVTPERSDQDDLIRRAGAVRLPALLSQRSGLAPPWPLPPRSRRSRPRNYPELPRDRGRALRQRRGGRALCRPHRRDDGAVRRAGAGRRRVHPLQMPLGAGRLVPRATARRARRARWSSIPATPTPSPAPSATKAVNEVAEAAAKATGAAPAEMFMASTGVIGEPLEAGRIADVLGALAASAQARRADGRGARDHDHRHFSQGRDRSASSSATPRSTINGMAKGAGMIAPDMATMLAFVFTDAPIAAPALQALLSKGVERSFNAITVDSDTSTSDTLLLFATGAARRARRAGDRRRRDPRLAAFQARARQAAARSRPSGGARRRGRAQIRRGQGRGRRDPRGRQAHRPVDRQFAAGQDRGRRRGRQLGPRRHGGRQGGREGRARQARHLSSATSASPMPACAIPTTTRRRPPPI